ncbi:MAG: PEP-CTERM sorting domain-containing protein [Phycisphaera sp.]|nr:PEP-CTERM sorting domain-containing protein [Phycisphaera sp.]
MNVGVTAIWLPGIATAAETNNTTEYFRYSYQSLVDDVLFDSDTLTFTVTPGGGESLDFISLTFDGINYTGGAGVSHYIYSTLVDGTIDNSTTDRIGTFLVPGGSNSTWSSFNLDLSAYTDISVATTFRIELFTTGNSGGNWNGIDNITLNANVNSVPEPASLALLGVGGLLIAGRRRRALV